MEEYSTILCIMPSPAETLNPYLRCFRPQTADERLKDFHSSYPIQLALLFPLFEAPTAGPLKLFIVGGISEF